MRKPSFLNERGVPIVGKRVFIPYPVVPYRDGAKGVITRSGWVGGADKPFYMFVRLERLGNPAIKLRANDWYKCMELSNE